jgi:hypothetical protein
VSTGVIGTPHVEVLASMQTSPPPQQALPHTAFSLAQHPPLPVQLPVQHAPPQTVSARPQHCPFTTCPTQHDPLTHEPVSQHWPLHASFSQHCPVVAVCAGGQHVALVPVTLVHCVPAGQASAFEQHCVPAA